MTGKMPTLTGRSLDEEIQLIELSPHSRLPRLDLGVDWESPWREFRTSVRDFFTGPRAPKGGKVAGNHAFRVEWVRGKISGWAFTASSLWHVAVVVLLILPIWGFLPATQHNSRSGSHRADVSAHARSAADLAARSAVETEPGRRSREAAATARGRCLPSATNDTFNARERDASAPNPDSAERAGGRTENRCADAEYGAMVFARASETSDSIFSFDSGAARPAARRARCCRAGYCKQREKSRAD